MFTQAKDEICKPNQRYAYVAATKNNLVENSYFTKANKLLEWIQTMAEEFTALQQTGTLGHCSIFNLISTSFQIIGFIGLKRSLTVPLKDLKRPWLLIGSIRKKSSTMRRRSVLW